MSVLQEVLDANAAYAADFFEVTNVIECIQCVVGVTKPAKTVVPIPARLIKFRKTGCSRSNKAARVFVLVKLERKRGTDNFLLVKERN